jgi:Mg2+-importing ATPase
MSIMVIVVFTANAWLGRPAVETFLFAVALAVGLSPELLPAILSVNLARGAQLMAKHGVLVRKLHAIENLGAMDILCTDKTGTLTEGVVRLDGAYDSQGARSALVLELASRNAALQTGLENPLDRAIADAGPASLDGVEKLAEVPYDFTRKRLSVVYRDAHGVQLVTKGAFESVLSLCTHLSGGVALDAPLRAQLMERFHGWSEQGVRVLAVAMRSVPEGGAPARELENELVFMGFLTFVDRPKEGVASALANLAKLGVQVKLITGDVGLVAQHVAREVGMPGTRTLTGDELDALHDEALWSAAEQTDLFVQVDPNQKERIILALKKMGHVVGFMGDGVNDAPAMHAADTSLSVDTAVDVAKDAADFVLLERDLDAIRRGIEAGRTTFANTLKYVLTTTSANLGNMLSMAFASFFVPFLPLTAGQILLNNFLSDVPALGIADDSVDPEQVVAPGRWDMRMIGRSMLALGTVSSLFDALTFVVLLRIWHAGPAQFRSAWFLESLLTELCVALVVRTHRRFYRSRPGALLWKSTLVVALIGYALPYLPFAATLGLEPLPPSLLGALTAITLSYVFVVELAKRHLFASAQPPAKVARSAAPQALRAT